MSLLLAETVFATSALRHSRIHGQTPRRALQVSARRNCPERRVPIAFQASGFAQEPSLAWRRAAPLVWLRLPKTCHRIRHRSRPLRFHAPAPAQTRSLLPAHELGCRNAQVALRCTIASLAPAPPRFVAQAPLHSASPNYSWCGRAGSGVPFLGTAAARRTTGRWTTMERHTDHGT